MTRSSRFSYIDAKGETTVLPYMPIRLSFQKNVVAVSALIDSGSAINVLPYNIGLQLGLDWDEQTNPIALTGNLARLDARGVIIKGQVEQLPAVDLAFAWTQSNDIPAILGQINFFSEFDVYFSRSTNQFEITLRG